MPKYVIRPFPLTGDYAQVSADRLEPIFTGQNKATRASIAQATARLDREDRVRNLQPGLYAKGQRFRTPSFSSEADHGRMYTAPCWDLALCAGSRKQPPDVPNVDRIWTILNYLPCMNGGDENDVTPSKIEPENLRGQGPQGPALLSPIAQEELRTLFNRARADFRDGSCSTRWTVNQKSYHKRIVEMIIELHGFSIRDFHVYGPKYEIVCTSSTWWSSDHWGIRRISGNSTTYMQTLPSTDVYIGGTSLWSEGFEITPVKISRIPHFFASRLRTLVCA